MARNNSFTPYDDRAVRAFDEDANDPEFRAYGSRALMATEDDAFPADRMPLFLSGAAEEPLPRGFGSGGQAERDTVIVWPRIFKAAMFTTAAAVIAFAIVTVGNPLALFADAKASLPDTAVDQSVAAQKSEPQAAAAAQSASVGPTPVMPPTASVRSLPPAPKVTRDDIALALRAAQQNQLPTEPPPPAAAPAVRRLGADELAALLKRAKGLIAIGDIAPARLLLERAADAQEAGAALLLAQTYDPAVLGTPDMRSITPDPAKARDWYQKAARLGSLDAKQRLAQMQN